MSDVTDDPTVEALDGVDRGDMVRLHSPAGPPGLDFGLEIGATGRVVGFVSRDEEPHRQVLALFEVDGATYEVPPIVLEREDAGDDAPSG